MDVPLSSGLLVAFPGDAVEAPLINTLSFSAGQTRANNAVLALAGDGSGTIKVVVVALSEGTADVLLDVSGYFQ